VKRSAGYIGYAGKLLDPTQIIDIAQPANAVIFEDNRLIIKKINRERSDLIMMSYTLSTVTDIPNTLKSTAIDETCPGG